MANYVQQEQYVPFIKPYVQGAIPEYAALQEQLKKDYDETQAGYDAFKEAAESIKALPGDESKKKVLMDRALEEFNKAAESGDYENRRVALRRAVGKFKKEYAPIAEEVQKRQEYVKQIEEELKAKLRTPEEAREMIALADKEYASPDEKGNTGFKLDSEGNKVKGYNAYRRAYYVNELEKINEVLKNKLAHPYSRIVQVTSQNDDGSYQATTKEGVVARVEASEINSLIKNAINTDEQWKAYLYDKGYYKANLASEQELANFSNRYLNQISERLITPEILEQKKAELKSKYESENKVISPEDLEKSAISSLQEQNYYTPQQAESLNQKVLKNARAAYKDYIIGNEFNDVINTAEQYAFEQTISKSSEEIQKTMTNGSSGGGFSNDSNTITSQGYSTTNNVSSLFTDIISKTSNLKTVQEKLKNDNFKLVPQLAKTLNVSVTDYKALSEKLKPARLILADDLSDARKIEELKNIGISVSNERELTNFSIQVENYTKNADAYRQATTNIEYLTKQQERLNSLIADDLKPYEDKIKDRFFDNTSYRSNNTLQKAGLNINTYTDVAKKAAVLYEKPHNQYKKGEKNSAHEFIDNYVDSLKIPQNIKSVLKRDLKFDSGYYQSGMSLLSEKVAKTKEGVGFNTTNTFLISTDAGSLVGQANKVFKDIYSLKLLSSTVAGSKDMTVTNYLQSVKGYSPEEIRTAVLKENAIETMPVFDGENYQYTSYVSIELNKGGEKVIERVSLNSDAVNEPTSERALIGEYYKEGFNKKTPIGGQQFKLNQGNIAFGLALKKLGSEANKILTMDDAQFGSYEPMTIKSSSGITYNISDQDLHFELKVKDANGEDVVKRFQSPRDLLEFIGHIEVQNAAVNIYNK